MKHDPRYALGLSISEKETPAWDANIRLQIRDCALFVPVVSAHTQERREGYFRREWNLAVERTLDMAHGAPFLLPVVVDGTTERDAPVPEAFLTRPNDISPSELRDDPFLSRLKDDPRFEEILQSAKPL